MMNLRELNNKSLHELLEWWRVNETPNTEIEGFSPEAYWARWADALTPGPEYILTWLKCGFVGWNDRNPFTIYMDLRMNGIIPEPYEEDVDDDLEDEPLGPACKLDDPDCESCT